MLRWDYMLRYLEHVSRAYLALSEAESAHEKRCSLLVMILTLAFNVRVLH